MRSKNVDNAKAVCIHSSVNLNVEYNSPDGLEPTGILLGSKTKGLMVM